MCLQFFCIFYKIILPTTAAKICTVYFKIDWEYKINCTGNNVLFFQLNILSKNTNLTKDDENIRLEKKWHAKNTQTAWLWVCFKDCSNSVLIFYIPHHLHKKKLKCVHKLWKYLICIVIENTTTSLWS